MVGKNTERKIEENGREEWKVMGRKGMVWERENNGKKKKRE